MVKVDDLDTVLEKKLETAIKNTIEGINKEIERISEDAVKELKQTSPRSKKKGSHYADGWAVKADGKSLSGINKKTIYNKRKPQITHLLEHGHAIAGGTGRVYGIPHIKPIEDKIEKEIRSITKHET